jgi:glycosyltransferase involved in cell wall biosynthesis
VTAVLHVIDRGCDETQLQVLELLRSRQGGDDWGHVLCTIDGPSAIRAARFWQGDVHRAERRLLPAMNWAPQLARVARRTEARILHAWGLEAAAACSARLPDVPLVMTLLDPDATRDAAKWLRSFPTDATVVAGTQVVRSRLVTAGVAMERIVVIRGPVDFGDINQARRQDVRQDVVGDARPVLLLSGPPSRGGGQFQGVWAAAVLRQVYRDLRVVMPYDSPEARRLHRFALSTRIPNLLAIPDARLTWPQLLDCADVFVVPAADEVCTEPISTAMAAGVVVVGTAVRSVAELIGHQHNGLLCKPGQPRLLAGRIITALEDQDLRRRITEVARGQAYEVSSVRAFVDNYARLHENVLAGKAPGDGVRDMATIT